MCVCCTHPFSFFPLVFVLVNDLFSGFCVVFCCFLFALEMRTILFLLLLFVSFCCMHLHFMFIAVSNRYEICQMFFHCCFMYRHWLSEINYVTCYTSLIKPNRSCVQAMRRAFFFFFFF